MGELLEYDLPNYVPEPLPIDCPLIPVIYPQISEEEIPGRFPEIDAWAVPIHKVVDRKRQFRSTDLKDYLRLLPHQKLILSTCAPDHWQQWLWAECPHIGYEQHGIDYWFPGHFSIYDDDSMLCQFANAKRQQLHAAWTKSQFVWFRLGQNIPREFLAPVRGASSVLISTQQMYSKRSRDILHREVRSADEWFPESTAFYVVGRSGNLPISEERRCYEINSRWLMSALKGHNLSGERVGKKQDNGMDTAELLAHNLEEALKNV